MQEKCVAELFFVGV